MSINRFLLFFLFLISIFDKLSSNSGMEIKHVQDYVFLLLFSDEQDTNYYYLKFGLGNLKKSHFPSGPSISNDFSVQEHCKVEKDIWQEINNRSINLFMFCIEEPIVDSQGETRFLKRCGFELPNDKNVSYLFNLDNNFHNIKGVIILSNELDKILQSKLTESSCDEPFSIVVPEDPVDLTNIDIDAVLKFKKKEDPIFLRIIKNVGGFLCTQYYATSDAIVKYKKKLIEFFKSVHSYPSTSSGRTD